MSRYALQDDPLCYPGTQVLMNRAGLHDQDQLDQFEHLMFLTRAEEPLPPGNLDFVHYKAIHQHYFQDVYDWAGKPRSIRTGKGGNWFCYPEFIDIEMERVFTQLADEGHLANVRSRQEFAVRASQYIADVNAIHPFREGNGRCQLTLLSILSDLAGFPMDEDQIDPPALMTAMIASFAGDLGPLAEAILIMSGED